MPYVKAADVFALPSLHEGQPMVFFEAAVLNKPVLVGNNPGSIEVLDYVRGAISGETAPQIAAALKEIVSLGAGSNFDSGEYQAAALSDFHHLIDEVTSASAQI